ncbi:MAG: ABC transporter ATP-binding protein [Candidatus Nanopelagicales bacterium]|jgi:peptide/nickel transport system ATP-binding protein|nr:ABC transporter ATP-binding protein [Candidatus Nanopelagicales bacterium]
MSAGPMLEVDDLSISYGSRLLVNGVSFALDSGESLALVGESGSGKSLTARAIADLLPAGVSAIGRVLIEGAPVRRPRRRGRDDSPRVGLLMQDPFTMLNPTMTAGGHIAETLRAAGRPRAEIPAEVSRRLAEVGITDASVARRYPFELSGGMSQRVALAAALANDPALLLADEPTTALDATTQHEVLELLRQVQRDRGMGLVFITHDLRVAFDLCHRVVVMYAGSIMEEAPAGVMRRDPLHPYTRGLLESIPSTDHYQGNLRGIPGSVPATHTVLDRCPFADRCDERVDACTHVVPPLVEVAAHHRAACIRIGEVASKTTAASVGSTRVTAHVGDEVVVRVRDLKKSYRVSGGVHPALDGVSFDLRQGEALGIVGESGSGKTTIARCLLGLTNPTDGTIEFADFGVVPPRRSAQDRRAVAQIVQCVFQDPYSTLNPMHSVGTALGEALSQRSRPVTNRDHEIASLLDRVGLPASMATRRPASLSGGQRQRVAIARALAVEPRVLLCDEPVAALDVSVQAQILELLREVNRTQGTSLLFITHDLGVVRQITERVLVLYRGEIVEQGATDVVLDAPEHDYTQRLVAAMPSTHVAQEA